MTEPTTTTETSAIKIPIFLGINNKEKLDQVISILKDDDVYEIAIISAEKYRELIMEYQYAKMTKEHRESVQSLLRNEEAIAKTHKLMLDLSESKYTTINRNELKLFMRLHRGKALTNKEADEILDVMYAMKKVELLNPECKQYEYQFKLLINDSDHFHALAIKTSAIKEQIAILSQNLQDDEETMMKLEKQIEAEKQNAIAIVNDDSTADIPAIQPNIESNSDIQ